MKKGLGSHGYTIVEVMIVLAISSVLMISALLLISGRQAKTEFNQSINDIQAQINDVINNVSTGYYASRGAFSCTNCGGVPSPAAGGDDIGTKKDCILLGRAIQFSVNGKKDAYNQYDIIGVRSDLASGQEVDTMPEANPRTLTPVSGEVDTTEAGSLLYGLEAEKMYYIQSGVKHDIGSVAFLSSLGSYQNCQGLCSGAQTIGLWPVQGTNLTNSDADAQRAISTANAANLVDLTNTSDGAVVICFKSGGTDQYGILTIGSNNRQLSTQLDIQNSTDARAGKCS